MADRFGSSTRAGAESDYLVGIRERVVEAALPHVAFDGWTNDLLREAVAAAGIGEHEAQIAFPRGPIDLAVAAHRYGDRRFEQRMAEGGEVLRIRERIARAVRLRLEIAGEHEEAVRRAAALFALPHNAPEGARLTWGTADAIWRAVGDTSTDYNWYTKRLTLSGVYSATLLFWLGDTSVDKEATWRFLDRRIEDVMRFEKVKAAARNNPLARLMLAGPRAILGQLRAPGVRNRAGNLPVGFPGRK